MRRNFMKKAVAVTLSAAMAFSMSAANNLKTASAATTVSLKTTFKTLEVGQVYKLKLKINKLNWKITKVKSNDSSICKATVKDNSAGNYVRLAAKSEGRTSVWVTVKSSKRKNTARRRCRVVVNDSSAPVQTDPTQPAQTDPTQPAQTDPTQPAQTDPTQAPVENEKIVTNQDELNEALANKDVTKITIRIPESTEETKLVIGEEDYSTVDLFVQAPSAEIENSGKFHSISIEDLSEDTWIENAVGNSIRMAQKNAHIVVGPKGHIDKLTFAQKDADARATVEVHGKVTNLEVEAQTKLNVNIAAATAEVSVAVNVVGVEVNLATSVDLTPEEKEAIKGKINVIISSVAIATKVFASVPTSILTHANLVEVTLNKGAEGSEIQAGVGATEIGKISNQTEGKVTVKDANGETVDTYEPGDDRGTTIDSNASTDSTDSTNPSDASTTPSNAFETDPTEADNSDEQGTPVTPGPGDDDDDNKNDPPQTNPSQATSAIGIDASAIIGGEASGSVTDQTTTGGSITVSAGALTTVTVTNVKVTNVSGSATIKVTSSNGTPASDLAAKVITSPDVGTITLKDIDLRDFKFDEATKKGKMGIILTLSDITDSANVKSIGTVEIEITLTLDGNSVTGTVIKKTS